MFITFEGGEGSGKTTIINEIQKFIEKDLGLKALVTREPGGSVVAEKIRNIILDSKNENITSETEALLFAASRTQHLEEIVIPALNDGKIVLSDRYVDSSLAYQGYARGLGFDFIVKVNDYAFKWLPDLTFYLDLPPEVGLKRIRNRDNLNRLDLETLDFHKKVRKGYHEVLKRYPKRVIKIDVNRPISEIVKEIKQILRKNLNKEIK